MAFIKANATPKTGKTTHGLYIGTPEAEGENNPGQGLKEFYEDYLGIDDAFVSGKFLIIGRKGVGKSAYVKHLYDNSSLDNHLLCSIVKYNTVKLSRIIQEIPEDIGNKYCVIYEWIILSEMVKLLLQNTNISYSNGYVALKKFVEKNSGVIDITQWMTVAEKSKSSFEVNFYDLMKCMPAKFGIQFDRSKTKAPFYKLIPSLKSIVSEMLAYDGCSDINFIVIFDDLDIGFDLKNDQHKIELMELIRTARDYNTQVFPNRDSRVLLMLRDDIAMRLDGIAPDKNKIFSSYEYRLNWYDTDKNADDRDSIIRRFINRRISIGLSKLGVKFNKYDAWSSLVLDEICQEYNGKTAFKFVLDCSFYRPRDLVALFKDIGKCNYTIPIVPTNMKKLISHYVVWNAKETKDELSNMFSKHEVDSVFSLLSSVAESSNGFSYDEVIDGLRRRHLGEDTFEVLLDYSLLVPMDERDHQFFSYREKTKREDEREYRYRLPKVLYVYFKPYTL